MIGKQNQMSTPATVLIWLANNDQRQAHVSHMKPTANKGKPTVFKTALRPANKSQQNIQPMPTSAPSTLRHPKPTQRLQTQTAMKTYRRSRTYTRNQQEHVNLQHREKIANKGAVSYNTTMHHPRTKPTLSTEGLK